MSAVTKPTVFSSDKGRRRRLLLHHNFHAIIVGTIALLITIPLWIYLVFYFPLNPSPHPPLKPFPSILLRDGATSDQHSQISELPPLISLRHIVFGIASSAHLWPRRREYVRLWWRSDEMRGDVWLDSDVGVVSSNEDGNCSLPRLRVSEDTSRFRYTNPTGHPSGLRIARIVTESFRLGYEDVRWFLLCDDDTIVNAENLMVVLGKYDWREMVYVGGSSESHSANTHFSHSMGFGGAGIAISYPLARALVDMEDECLERYPMLYGSDDRLHACITEIGVPLFRENGFHQLDIRGNAAGILAAHPITPFVSIHHVESLDPLYPGLNSLDSLKLFTKAMTTHTHTFLQRSICYDRINKLTISVSLGYVVQVFPDVVLPRELERSEKTYIAWNKIGRREEFDFDTRESYSYRSLCRKPVLFFLRDVKRDEGGGNVTIGSYSRLGNAGGDRSEVMRKIFCFPRWSSSPLLGVQRITVLGNPLRPNWHLVNFLFSSSFSIYYIIRSV